MATCTRGIRSSAACPSRVDGLQPLVILRRVRILDGALVIDGDARDKRTEFESLADFFSYRQAELSSCDVSLETTRTRPQLFTFCTCSYFMNPDNERTLVFAQ